MRGDGEDQIARVRAEISNGTFVHAALGRASRRKSRWNLLLPAFALPLWLVLTCAFVLLAWLAHRALHPGTAVVWREFLDADRRITIPLVLVPSLLASIFPAFVVTNALVGLVPAARRALDREGRGGPGTDLASSQRALKKAGAFVVGVAAILVLTGAALVGAGR